ncbi:ECF transporter S component (folate family) [Peptoniphilus koenoeneniae]|uniref:ECF transporter S component (Folate family) n=1 Tax=Peptoniphilus koenoeneniae TaxID=507751 RepID=A0ABU0AU53_9FIRM|nr:MULTISPECIES: folate family ECF transporter S component [Peptoniphilus]ERT61619.1 PF12822 family protein [Peptoniphilus sp. BV3C26]MDQ0274327.1 ECF transporter S component (folate family) [Peptoniphilus koenoeneniae]
MKTIFKIFMYGLSVFLTMTVSTVTLGSPKVYLGIIAALILVLFAARLSEEKWAGFYASLSIAIGIILQIKHPIFGKMKAEKLEKLKPLVENYHNFLIKYGALIVIGIGIIAYFISKIKIEKKESTKFRSTRTITYMSVFIALSVVINTMRFGSISFGGFPIIYSGLVLGPVNGFIVGGVSDVLAFIVRPSSGGYNILFTLTSALTGFIPAIITGLFKDKYPNYRFFSVLIGVFIGQMITSVIMAPFFQSILYGKNTFYYYAAKAFIKQIVSIPIYSGLFISLNESLKKNINFNLSRK